MSLKFILKIKVQFSYDDSRGEEKYKKVNVYYKRQGFFIKLYFLRQCGIFQEIDTWKNTEKLKSVCMII